MRMSMSTVGSLCEMLRIPRSFFTNDLEDFEIEQAILKDLKWDVVDVLKLQVDVVPL